MFISRFFAVAVGALASVSFVGAAPTAEKDVLVKRDTPSSVLTILTELNVHLAVPIALINTAVSNHDVSMATVGGPCNSIISLLTSANVELQVLLPGPWDGHGPVPPSYNGCVDILVLIITVLIPCLGQLVPFCLLNPVLAALVINIDICLSTLLTTIHFLLHIVLYVGGLVVNVKLTLQALLFFLTLGCLGL